LHFERLQHFAKHPLEGLAVLYRENGGNLRSPHGVLTHGLVDQRAAALG
jgi:hypothetical protein